MVCHTPTDIELPAATARFCALLSPGDITAQAWGLRVEGDRGWLHIPNAGDQPITLPDLDPTLIAQQLHDLTSDDALTPAPDEPASGPDHPTPAAVSVTPIQPRYCEVGVLGPVTVTRNGIDLDGLTPIARQLLTYLATHRDAVGLERLDAAIWPDRPPSRGGQRARTALTRLRHTLGDGPDGEPLLPRRDHADQPVQLAAHVGTDLDRALELLTNARHHEDPTDTMTDQLAALELIRGSPFQDLTVSWSVDIEQRAIAQLQDAAVAVATALSNTNESDRAVWAIQQGLLLCDPAEHLYLAWARIEQARGRADRIPQLWRRLRRLYTDDADEIAGVMTTPTTETEHAFTKLMADSTGERTGPVNYGIP